MLLWGDFNHLKQLFGPLVRSQSDVEKLFLVNGVIHEVAVQGREQ